MKRQTDNLSFLFSKNLAYAEHNNSKLWTKDHALFSSYFLIIWPSSKTHTVYTIELTVRFVLDRKNPTLYAFNSYNQGDMAENIKRENLAACCLCLRQGESYRILCAHPNSLNPGNSPRFWVNRVACLLNIGLKRSLI
jgi:hypothetical protein